MPVTYRKLVWSRLTEAIRESARGLPRLEGLDAALREFRIKFDAAVDAVPKVALLLDRPGSDDQSDDGVVDPINRADEIIEEITEKLRSKRPNY